MRRWSLILCLAAMITAWPAPPAVAHEVRPAYLELRQITADTYDVVWKVPARGEDMRLSLHVEFPEGTSNVTPPRMSMLNNASTERWSVTRSGGLTDTTIRIGGLSATMTDVLVRVESLDGNTQVTRLTPASTSFVLAAVPSSAQVVRTYLVLGMEHILFGFDHLLFVLALVILVKGRGRLIGTITAFTAAHSITLAAATLGFVHVPGPPVEALIALSIVFVATEIVRGRNGQHGITSRAPWAVAFTFGLLHGLGFAGALSEAGLPQTAVPLALLFFNVGVEIGQLIFIGAVMSAIALVTRAVSRAREPGAASAPLGLRIENVAAYAIGSVASFWLIERTIGAG